MQIRGRSRRENVLSQVPFLQTPVVIECADLIHFADSEFRYQLDLFILRFDQIEYSGGLLGMIGITGVQGASPQAFTAVENSAYQ